MPTASPTVVPQPISCPIDPGAGIKNSNRQNVLRVKSLIVLNLEEFIAIAHNDEKRLPFYSIGIKNGEAI